MNQILKFEDTKQQITIDKDTCDDIRVADINFQSQKNNIINLLETHAMDLADTLTQTVLLCHYSSVLQMQCRSGIH